MADPKRGDVVIAYDPPGSKIAAGVTRDDYPRFVVLGVVPADPPHTGLMVVVRKQDGKTKHPAVVPLEQVEVVEEAP